MKKIFKQLCKLFPETTITIEHCIRSYGDRYKVYIDKNYKIWNYNWSPEFKTLKELDEHLNEKIDNYKKVY